MAALDPKRSFPWSACRCLSIAVPTTIKAQNSASVPVMSSGNRIPLKTRGKSEVPEV